MIGDVLWSPPADWRETTELGRLMDWLRDHRGQDLATYEELHRWSVSDLEGFWGGLWEFYGIRAAVPYERVLADRTMPGAKWFPAAKLNYAEHLVGSDEDRDQIAVVARSQTRPPRELTFGELRELAGRVRAGLQRLGVEPGDRVVAYMPNIPETLAAFIATASLGAIWATCAPEFGARSVIGRFGQIEPRVLLTVGGYQYRDRYVDRRAEVEAIRAQLPTLEHVIAVPYGDARVEDTTSWEDLTAEDAPLEFDPVDFNHPLYILFSSGTTGLPKAIVHSHGGQLIEHHKNQGIGWDLKPGGRLLWFSTTAWMMWNALVSALLVRSSIVMLDGDPAWPDLLEQWRLAEELRPTVMGVSPAYLMACRKAGIQPGREFDLSSIRMLCTAGSPLPAEGYTYAYEQLGPEMLLNNGSGGTDVCTGLVSGSYAQPVYEGEITGPCLGVDAHAFDPEGHEAPVGELGELVITAPMPSMPVAFWNDESGARYHASYFDMYPGVWRQGDWIKFTERGSCILTGRSDATLNRAGVRLGTGEFYAVVEDIPEVLDALVVHLEDPGGGAGELLLFVVPAPGAAVDGLSGQIAKALRTELSPRHVPDTIVPVPAIPRTLTGKKLEAPVKRILQGEAPERVASRDSLADPAALDAFVELAGKRLGGGEVVSSGA